MSKLPGSLSHQARIRLQGGDLIERGFDNEEIMEILEVSLSSVRWKVVGQIPPLATGAEPVKNGVDDFSQRECGNLGESSYHDMYHCHFDDRLACFRPTFIVSA